MIFLRSSCAEDFGDEDEWQGGTGLCQEAEGKDDWVKQRTKKVKQRTDRVKQIEIRNEAKNLNH